MSFNKLKMIRRRGVRSLNESERLMKIRQIIEDVDNRCLAADGPVTPTREEITKDELCRIYALACGKPESWRAA